MIRHPDGLVKREEAPRENDEIPTVGERHPTRSSELR
jgi:hypothetical protein